MKVSLIEKESRTVVYSEMPMVCGSLNEMTTDDDILQEIFDCAIEDRLISTSAKLSDYECLVLV